MRRVTRESGWGKLINKQVTRWVGSRQIDMRAHGTPKTRTEAACSHKTKTQAHGQQTKSPAMCKTGHEHAANEKTHKPRVYTRHDNIKALSQWNTQAACHTAQDITWLHAADRNTNCVQHNKTHMDRRACGPSKLETAHSHNDRKRSASVRTPTRNRNSRHECRIRTPRFNMKQGMLIRPLSSGTAAVATGRDVSVPSFRERGLHT